MADKLIVELDLETGDIKTAFDKIQKKSSESGKKSGSNFGKNFSASVSSFIGNVAAIGFTKAVSGIKNELGRAIDAAKNLEVIETQFKTILKSTDAAQKQIKDLQDFAATTPFQLNGLSVATRQLLSFGVAQEKIIPTLRQIGELAAGTGSDIADLTIPFGRLVSTQKLTLVELDKFADRGINLYGKLSEQTGISLKEIRDEISKGRVPFDEFTKALNDLTGQGGLFFQATLKQSQTLEGTLSTLGDNADQLRGSFGKLFSPFLLKGAQLLTTAFQNLNTKLSGISTQDAIESLFAFNKAVIEFVVAPLELVANIGTFVFKKVVESISATVASLGFLGGKLAEFLEFINVDAPEGLTTFAESSRETFNEAAAETQTAFDNIFSFPVSDKLATANEELRDGLTETNTILEEQAKATKKIVDKNGKNISKTASNVQKIINNSLVRGISGGIQNVVQSLQKGEDVFANFGKFVLTAFGDLAITLGEFFIAEGIATQALIAINPPSATIAAGAALVALGTLIKGFAGGGTSGGGGGGGGAGGGVAGPAAGGIQPIEFVDNETLNTEPNTNVTVQINGDVLDSDETGTRIAEILSDSFGKQGIVLTDARFA